MHLKLRTFGQMFPVVFGAIESSVKAKPVGTAGDDAFSNMSCRIFTKQ